MGAPLISSWKASSSACLETCNQYLKDSIIWSYANHNTAGHYDLLVGWLIVAALMFATWLPPALFSISGSGRDWSQQRGLWQALQHRLYADRVAGRHPLPSATAFLWSHLLCKTAVLFTRNCYQRRGQKKTITCPEQLISVSCICMSAKILPYTETLRRGPSKPVQGLRALSSECT